jgi:signal transduction histidine kinase
MAGTVLMIAHGGIGRSDAPARGLDALAVVLAAGASLPLLAWRRHPMAVLVTTMAFSATIQLLSYPGGPPLGGTIALYLLAASKDDAHPWTVRTTLAVTALFSVHFAAYAIGHGTLPATELAIGALVWAVAWFAGDRTRLRRAEIEELERRAARADQDAERDRRLAAAEERARIARDLHDSAGHAINVIAVQAGAARLWHERDPGQSRAALETIEQVARQTVADIDQIVRNLRVGHGAGDGVEAPPGIAALSGLIRDHASTGLAVTLTSRGQLRHLHSSADQAAYRISQEALTNAARHGTGTAEVVLDFGADELDMTITNPVVGHNGTNPVVGHNGINGGGGHGLIGMRERAALLGGSLTVQRSDGTFNVHARIPYGD